MAGIEQLEIHSKSYIVRWARVDEGYTISWSVQPHKKSINFGIVKHPGTGATNLTTFQSDLDDSLPDPALEAKAGLFNKKDPTSATTAPEQLRKKGFKLVKWHGKCDADKLTTGTFDVVAGNGGMFGLVFDNTFSKQTSKNATFVLLTYPTGAPPQGAHTLPNTQGGQVASPSASGTSLGRHNSPALGPGHAASESVDSLGSHLNPHAGAGAGAGAALASSAASISARPGTSAGTAAHGAAASTHVGTLLKRRRKKGQGYARRFFSLDYGTCTLSYYYNRTSSALRGAIPLSLAAIAADERRREITIDSGAEVWHLKASSVKEFTEWARALERASRTARGLEQDHKSQPAMSRVSSHPAAEATQQALDDDRREWQQVEALVGRVVGTRDALRRLVKDTSVQQYAHGGGGGGAKNGGGAQHLSPASAMPEEADDQVPQQLASSSASLHADRRPFWRRKSSAPPPAPHVLQSALAVPAPSSASVTGPTGRDRAQSAGAAQEDDQIAAQCQALLGDLDSVVAEFTELLSKSKQRRTGVAAAVAAATANAPRRSLDSTTSDEFFDAAEGEADRPQVVRIDGHSEAEDTPGTDGEEVSVHDASSASSVGDEEEYAGAGGADSDGGENLFPVKPKSLAPLPITETVQRRTAIPPSTVLPPSLIAFVRKNVGKDLSTISMPVSANEPTSMLQRIAEQLEYAQLLDEAVAKTRGAERLAYVTAFAVSQFSGGRMKERSIRKPFNPLLGETFELVRTETEVPGGLRLLVEKVSHRPVRLVIQADAAAWSFAQAPAPSQKFWGKSAEIITEGRARLVLRLADGSEEKYSWALATVFLRNVVMGEKYVEPVGTMSVVCESSGAKAAVEFRTKGMFGGRSEDVQAELYDGDGRHAGLALTGTWTQALRLVEQGAGSRAALPGAGTEIWRVGPLVDDAAHVYGLPRFAAQLNEITPLESGRMAPTDCRLRPDQRLAEEGLLDDAEAWKTRLEEAQRVRRRELEERGEPHRPRWFTKVADGPDGDEVWRLKTGKDGYWEERARGAWTGVEDLFSG